VGKFILFGLTALLSVNAYAITSQASIRRETKVRLKPISTEEATPKESDCINAQITELNKVNWLALKAQDAHVLIPLRSYNGLSGQNYSYSNTTGITVSFGTASIVTDIVLKADGTCLFSTAKTITAEIKAAQKRDAR